MPRYSKHIFVCENVRPAGHSRGCCADKNGKEIRELLKKKIAELKLNSEIRVNSAGCLDACEFGPVMVAYPEQIWYGGVTIQDVDEIVDQHILKDQPVERLIIRDPKFE